MVYSDKMSSFLLIALYFFTFLFSIYLTSWFIKFSLRKNILDIPNQRSSHTIPTPRGGGAAIVISLTLSTLCLFLSLETHLLTKPLLIFLLCLPIALIGWIDDRRSLSARVRLITQLSCSSSISYLALNSSDQLTIMMTVCVISVLALTWLCNLYNFMDGVDGIAGLQVFLVSLFLGFLLYPTQPELSLCLWLTPAATLGFLIWNWPPAKVFMGDVGSAFLGLWLAGVSLYSWQMQSIDLLPILMVHGTFLTDATLTLFYRFIRKEKLSQAHRDHAYQHAVQMGFSHKKVTLTYGLLNALFLFPMAWLAQAYPKYSWALFLFTFILLFTLGNYFKAGRKIKS